ncbi:hypothetical protein HWV62_45244 [Athelia sp. TMB]|nr:hypothetical protein HWV62_45244 [Athelia sp. TMB]
MPMYRSDFVLQTAQCQRMALDVDAITMFLLRVQPRLSQTRVVPRAADHKLIGCFTNNPTIADLLYRGGVPFWLVRDVCDVPSGTLQVMHVVTSTHKSEYAVMDEYRDTEHPHPVIAPLKTIGIFGHQVERIERQRTMGRMYNNLIAFEEGPVSVSDDISPNPIQVSHIRTGIVSEDIVGSHLPGIPSGDGAQQLAPRARLQSVRWSDTTRCPNTSHTTIFSSTLVLQLLSWSFAIPPTVTRLIAAASSSRWCAKKVSQQKAAGQQGYNVQGDIATPCQQGQTWYRALATVNRSLPIYKDLDKSDAGYMFPDPGLIASFEPDKQMQAITIWLAIRTARASQLHKPGYALPRPLSASGWRDFFCDHVTAPHKWTEVDADINRKPLVSTVFIPSNCFTVEDPFQSHDMYIVEEHDLHAHHQALQNLRNLMVDWRNCPSALQQPFPDDAYGGQAQRIRTMVQKFYCSSFYSFFGRPPILPHHTAAHSVLKDLMSFKPKRPHGKGITNKSGPTVTLPERLLTTHDISRGHNYQVVPTVTPRGIAGTYTFSAPPTFHPPAAPAPTPPSPTLQDPDHPASDGLGHVGPSFSAKAAPQYATWTTDVIPSLVPVYLHLLRTTQSLTRPPVPSVPLCVCGKKKLVLNIVCLHFDSLCSRQVHSCHCDPVSAQLVREGLFPCAPIAPTLAVDLKLLEFARLQFLTMVPNKSGWCEAMELFLRGMSFKFVAQDNLHRRFSNAYHWYCTLLDATQGHIQVVIEDSRADFLSTSPLCHDATALPPSSPVTSSSSPPGSPRSPPSSTFQSTSSSQPGSPSMSEDDLPSSTAPIPQSTSPSTSDAGSSTRQSTPPVAPRSSCFPPSPKWTRPSKYLRRCCGLCFGGTGQHRYDDSIADFIRSIDACFTQKRNKNSKNPDYRDTERRHSNTVFLSEAEVEEMEEYIESIRARPAPAARRPTTGDDFVEDGMQIPVSVLEECGSSFVAADEKREKASTQFFADTGLMSLICRHDRVIFAVNMTHKGERQHYALALLKRFIAELPDNMTVGLLYDIACQPGLYVILIHHHTETASEFVLHYPLSTASTVIHYLPIGHGRTTGAVPHTQLGKKL